MVTAHETYVQMPIRLPARETIFVPSGEVAAEARMVTVRWDPGKRKPVPFTKCRARATDCGHDPLAWPTEAAGRILGTVASMGKPGFW